MRRKPPFMVVVVAALLAVAACGGESSNAGRSGSLELNLDLAGNVVLETVEYTVSGNGITPITGTIDVSGSGGVFFLEVRRIPVGVGFLLELTAQDTATDTDCEANRDFDISAGLVTPLNITFKCSTPSNTGGIRLVGGTANFCPTLTAMSNVPLPSTPLRSFEVEAEAVDLDSDPIAFQWTATAGSFGVSTAAATTFDCDGIGDVDVTVSVSDDAFVDCSDSETMTVTCDATGSTVVAMMGTTFASLTLGTGDPNETTISSVAGVDHGSTTGHTAWISTYDSASEIQWGASISAGDADGTGFATVTAADHDEVGNIYVTLQADVYPGALTLTSADNSTIQYTPPVDAGANHYGVAKISSSGIWQWYQPIERATGSGTSTYTRPATVSVYGGRIYVSAREGRMEAGQSLRYADQPGITFPDANSAVHPMIVLDAGTGNYILHRIDGSPNYQTIIRNDLGANPPPTTGAIGSTGWYSGTTVPTRNATLVLNYGEIGLEIFKSPSGRVGAHTLRDPTGNVVWSYLHNESGITSPQHLAYIGAAIETGDGAIFIGGVENSVPPPFNHTGGIASLTPWPGPLGENKGQYLVRYDAAGTIQWLSAIHNGNKQLYVTAGRPVNRSALYDNTTDRLYVVYAMPPYDVNEINGTPYGSFTELWDDPLRFGPGEPTETVVQHAFPILSTGPQDAIVVLAAYDAANGNFLWATSHRRPGPDLYLDERGPGGLYLDSNGGIVMLVGSGSGTTSFEDNGTPQLVSFTDAVMSAVTHDPADGSVTSIVEVESSPPTGTWEVTGTLAIAP